MLQSLLPRGLRSYRTGENLRFPPRSVLNRTSGQELLETLQAVVQVELDRMGRHLHPLDLLLLQRDVPVDQLVAEHVPLLQERAVAIERLERLLQREADGR